MASTLVRRTNDFRVSGNLRRTHHHRSCKALAPQHHNPQRVTEGGERTSCKSQRPTAEAPGKEPPCKPRPPYIELTSSHRTPASTRARLLSPGASLGDTARHSSMTWSTWAMKNIEGFTEHMADTPPCPHPLRELSSHKATRHKRHKTRPHELHTPANNQFTKH